MTNWILAGIMAGPLLYMFVTIFSKAAVTEEDYQFGERRLNPSDVVDSSIMYGLQVAAVALFATWGYLYGFWAMMVPVFWGAGYILFAAVLSEKFLRNFANDTRFRTLHGFLGDYNQARAVSILAALLTLVGLAGPAMFEVFTVGRIVASVTPQLGEAGGAGLALAFLSVSVVYMLWAGFPGKVRLDQIQLTLGYGGFCLAFALTLFLLRPQIGDAVTIWLGMIGALAASVIFILKFVYDLRTRQYLANILNGRIDRGRDVAGMLAGVLAILAFLVPVVAAITHPGPATGFSSMGFIVSKFSFGFTLLATVSLFIANGLYQFVDVTQWQRMLSIAVDRNDLAASARMLRSNIVVGGICGALTWVIAVAFGVFLRAMFPDPATDPYSLLSAFISSIATQSSPLAGPILFIFITALVAIMFSTLDALVAATSFTVQQDILAGRGGVAGARMITLGVIIAQLAFFLIISDAAKDKVDAILYICWSFQIAMVPTVVALLSNKGGSPARRFISLAAGACGALTPLLLGVPERSFELSPLLALAGAASVFLLSGLIPRRSN
jgi:hypothetical protein